MKGKVIALHSSRGGTGKTTIATNLAVDYAREGMNVALLDLDFRAPSLFGVFSNTLKKSMRYWRNTESLTIFASKFSSLYKHTKG